MRLTDTSDLFKFMNMVRDLLVWMDDVKREMTMIDKPRDVSGVELLMNNHQSLKVRSESMATSRPLTIEGGDRHSRRKLPNLFDTWQSASRQTSLRVARDREEAHQVDNRACRDVASMGGE